MFPFLNIPRFMAIPYISCSLFLYSAYDTLKNALVYSERFPIFVQNQRFK